MGQLVFQATLGGQVNLVGPNTASTFNINVPAVAGNMVTTGDTGTVTSTMLAGSIANAKLSNSSVTIGSTSVSLGATAATIAGLTLTTPVINGFTGDTSIVNIGSGQIYKDASGNVGIGTSSPSSIFQLNAATPIQTFNQTTANSNQGVQFKVAGTAYGQILNNATTGIMDICNGLSSGAGYVITFSTDGSERARIDSSGNLLVGTTTYAGSFSGYRIHVKGPNAGIGITATANGDYGIGFNNASNSLVGNITINSSTTAYNTSSDYRLKNTVVPMTGALARVAALKPCTYKWNVDDADGEGFIAHELAEVIPDAVTGEKDAVETYTDEEGNEQTRPKYQGIDTSFLVATLTAAIQELNAKFEEYKSTHP